MPDRAEMTTAEWVASLSADDCEELVRRTLAAGDVQGFDAALRLLSTKDAHRAEAILKTVEVGLALRAER